MLINPFRTSVSSCLKDFNKAVTRLQKVAAFHAKRKEAMDTYVDHLLDEVEKHQVLSDKASAEADAALLVAEKIKTTFHL
jgi:hypothetical protein